MTIGSALRATPRGPARTGRARGLRRGVLLTMTLLVTGTTLVVVPGWSSTVPAAADSTWGGIVGGVPQVIVVVDDERTLVRWESSRSYGPRWVCGYHPIVAPMHSVLDPSPIVDWTTRVSPTTGGEYMMGCFEEQPDGTRRLVRSRYVVFDPRDLFSGMATTERALDEARRRLELPMPDPVVNPPDEQLVGLPMWMWLERPWDRVSAVAAVGDTWAAVAAFPIMSRWTFADGSVVWCDQGVPYDTGRPARTQRSTCTHTFQHSSMWSDGGVEWVEVTMIWKVEWYSSDGSGQPLGTVERSSVFPVRVVEAQAVVR